MGQHLPSVLPGRMTCAAAYRAGDRRGLAIADQAKARERLKRQASIAFGSCIGCATPLAHVPKGQHSMVAAALRQAFLQADHDAARQAWRQLAEQLRPALRGLLAASPSGIG